MLRKEPYVFFISGSFFCMVNGSFAENHANFDGIDILQYFNGGEMI